MNKTIAVVICNYNKKDYVINNIESLLKQDEDTFDIYVVDNASIDGSTKEIQRVFGEKVCLICNDENLGESGGFNTGIRFVMEKGYQFIVLLDNDVILKEDAISTLYRDMIENPDVGIIGAKILKMDQPDIIQEFAPTLNFETMTFELNHGGERDGQELPHLAECDYVPACALMVRREVIEVIGCFPEENYIYYDDIIWGVRWKRAGYRVVADSKATVWHKGGAGINPTTFGSYYLSRNKIRFFLTYMQTDKPGSVVKKDAEARIDNILLELYEGIYSCGYRGMPSVAKTRMDALVDVLNGRTGKAEEYVIREREKIDEKLDGLILGSKNVRIYMNGLWENTRRILNHILYLSEKFKHSVTVELTDNKGYEGDTLLGVGIHTDELSRDEDYDLILHVCKHIYEMDITEHDRIWIDGWRNMIHDRTDFDNYLAFKNAYKIFRLCFEDHLKRTMKDISGDYSVVNF